MLVDMAMIYVGWRWVERRWRLRLGLGLLGEILWVVEGRLLGLEHFYKLFYKIIFLLILILEDIVYRNYKLSYELKENILIKRYL